MKREGCLIVQGEIAQSDWAGGASTQNTGAQNHYITSAITQGNRFATRSLYLAIHDNTSPGQNRCPTREGDQTSTTTQIDRAGCCECQLLSDNCIATCEGPITCGSVIGERGQCGIRSKADCAAGCQGAKREADSGCSWAKGTKEGSISSVGDSEAANFVDLAGIAQRANISQVDGEIVICPVEAA